MLVARYQGRTRALARLALPVGVVMIVVGLVQYGGMAVAPGASLLILWAVTKRPRIPGMARPANLSYAVYLWHVAVILSLVRGGVTGPPLVAVALPATILTSWLSYRRVERPVMRWASRHRLDRPLSAATPPALSGAQP